MPVFFLLLWQDIPMQLVLCDYFVDFSAVFAMLPNMKRLLKYWFLLKLCLIINAQQSVEDIVREIQKLQNETTTYRRPENAFQYKPENGTFENDFGSYDFVIIGAGTTGSVVASRLSEIENCSILLLEAGQFADEINSIPAVANLPMFGDYNWDSVSTEQKMACLGFPGRACPSPRGKGVGGTSLINDLLVARGNKEDFNRLSRMGLEGWSYEEVLPFFKKSENFNWNNPNAIVDENFHGFNGPLNVEYHIPNIPSSEIINSIFDAVEELGIKHVDYNGLNEEGFGYVQQTTKNGRRMDTETAFIKPFLGRRTNLRIMTESYVTRILFKNDSLNASFVQFSRNNQGFFVEAKKEVILCAGSIGSPQILLQSGIGPQEHLTSLGIKQVKELDVGSKLIDHVAYVNLRFTTNISLTSKTLQESVKEYLQGFGPLTVTLPIEGIIFHQSSWEKTPGYVDFEVIFEPQNNYDITGSSSLSNRTSFLAVIIALHSKSSGTVRLKSQDPFDYPLIDPNLLTDEEGHDIGVLYDGINLALSLLNTTTLKRIDAKLDDNQVKACLKENSSLDKEYWMCALRQFSSTAYHPMGTCRMGLDPKAGAVVDASLKVHGVEGLRVADASIFPDNLSGHPTAACVMVGEKISSLIKQEYNFPDY